jgi:hypothetical protein
VAYRDEKTQKQSRRGREQHSGKARYSATCGQIGKDEELATMSSSEFTLIASYSVVTQANQDPGNTLARHLYLEADPSASGTFKHFALYFFEPPQSLGYVNPNNGYVVPFLRLSDFSDIYNIVQSEKPVYTLFYADDSNQLQWFQVRTGAEPTGQGPVDFG